MNGSGMLLHLFQTIFRYFFQFQAARHTPDTVPDDVEAQHSPIEMATVAEWFGTINEINRARVLPGPRSLAELAFAVISIPEPLAGLRIRLFEPLPVIAGPRSLQKLAFDAIPVREPPEEAGLSNVHFNLFEHQPAVGPETEPLADPNSLCNYFNPNTLDEPVVDPIPSGSLSGSKIHCFLTNLEQTAAIPTTELPAEQNFNVQTVVRKQFWCYECQGQSNSLPWLLRLRYSKISMFSRFLSFFSVCCLVAFLFVSSLF